MEDPTREIKKRLIPIAAVLPLLLSSCKYSSTPEPPIYIETTNTSVTEQTAVPTADLWGAYPVESYSGDEIEYEGDSKAIIDKLMQEFGVRVVTPTVWRDAKGNEFQNTLWTPHQLSFLAQAVSSLPQAYHASPRSIREIILIKPIGTSGGVGGLYTRDRQMEIYAPENFDPYSQIGDGTIFEYAGAYLKAVVAHEWTHSFHEGLPEILSDWATATGWELSGSGWKYSGLKEGIMKDDLPIEEHFAIATGMMLTNSSTLSKTEKLFYQNNYHFSTWFPVQQLSAENN